MRITSILDLTARAILKLAAGLGLAALALSASAATITVTGGSSGCAWGTFTVDSTLNYTFNCGGATTVSPPVCTPTASPTSIATGGGATITANCTNSPTSYTWTTPSGAPAALATNSNNLTFYTQGSYMYSVTASNSAGPSPLANAPIITVSAPTPPSGCTLTPNPASITAGNSTTLTVSCTTGTAPFTYTWTSPASPAPQVPGTATNSSGLLAFPTAGSYNYSATVSNAVGSATPATLSVVVGAMVAPTCTAVASPNTLTTAGGNVTLTATCASSPISYTWTPGTGAPVVSGTGSSVSAMFPNPSVAGAFTYTVSATNGAGTSAAPATATISVVATQSIPAGCVVKDKSNIWPNWPAGLGYNTIPVPLHTQPANETWAFKFPASQLYAGTANALIYFYGANQLVSSITTSPCIFSDVPAVGECQKPGSDFFYLRFYPAAASKSAQDAASIGYCKLADLPTGQDYYYVNVRFSSPPFSVVGPSNDTCAASACGYYLMYSN